MNMSKIKTASNFMRFLWGAQTLYDVHSPFVYALAEAMLEDNRHYYAFSMIEPLRQRLLQNQDKINVVDYGAGSKMNNQPIRPINSIAKSALSPPFQTRMLFRLVNHLKPKTMLEMGTSLGISTMYQAAAAMNGQMITLEGSPEIAKVAQSMFKMYQDPLNIDLRVGQFVQTLPSALQQLEKLDYAFIDGNHRHTPTLTYFQKCLNYAHDQSVFVFDDIHWSSEMETAWEQIKANPRVTLTIDLYFMGLVFFRKENKAKQHFKLVKSKWKPWSWGFTGRRQP